MHPPQNKNPYPAKSPDALSHRLLPTVRKAPSQKPLSGAWPPLPPLCPFSAAPSPGLWPLPLWLPRGQTRQSGLRESVRPTCISRFPGSGSGLFLTAGWVPLPFLQSWCPKIPSGGKNSSSVCASFQKKQIKPLPPPAWNGSLTQSFWPGLQNPAK
ncbi:hypothetical protein IMSAGC019_00154 [Lachnospiraceae bacterium]|nr:hypothetical protein IMSAGC019_00154 [Lachnospiraceae bacterium]